jgi:hypothetical protein
LGRGLQTLEEKCAPEKALSSIKKAEVVISRIAQNVFKMFLTNWWTRGCRRWRFRRDAFTSRRGWTTAGW